MRTGKGLSMESGDYGMPSSKASMQTPGGFSKPSTGFTISTLQMRGLAEGPLVQPRMTKPPVSGYSSCLFQKSPEHHIPLMCVIS